MSISPWGKNSHGKDNGDVFNPFNYVYKIGQEQTYKKYLLDQYTRTKDLSVSENLTRYYKYPWRKNQISDHFPIWFEIITDSSDAFLASKLASYP